MSPRDHRRHSVERIGGYLHKITPIVDEAGRVVHHAVAPLMVEVTPRDLIQIVVGAALLSIPVGLTEEAWDLGQQLPGANIAVLAAVSVLFIALFVYYDFYHHHLRGHVASYAIRVAATYLISLAIAGALLTLIQRCPWGVDNLLALKRMVLVAFPSSMSAALSDSLR
ncbi:MAG: DUF2391 family protein [Myxococcota bacterium]